MSRKIAPVSPDEARILWAHVMRKAVEDFKLGSRSLSVASRKAYVDAKRWIWSEEEEFPSFRFLCDLFALSPARTRRTLLAYELHQRIAGPRRRPDVLVTEQGDSGGEGKSGHD